MLERPITPASAVEALLGRFDRPTIASTIEVLVALLDVTDGDPDVELNGDELDIAWNEHHTRGGHKITADGHEPFDPDGEDNELDDEPEDDDPGGGNVEDTGELVNEDGGDEDAQAGFVPIYGCDQSGQLMREWEAGDTFAATPI